MPEPTSERPEGEVAAALRRMDGRISDLYDILEKVSLILSPVLLSPEPTESAPSQVEDAPNACTLAQEIHSMSDRIHSLVRITDSLRDRIDL